MSTENSSHISQLYHSRNHLLDIMDERGFDVEDYKDFSITEVNSMKKNEQLDLLLNKSTSGEQIYIKYNLGKGLRPQNIDEMIEDLYDIEQILQSDDELLIITKTEPNDTLIKHMEKIWKTNNIFVNIIPLPRLCFNILKHSLVPVHEIVAKDLIYKQFNICIL